MADRKRVLCLAAVLALVALAPAATAQRFGVRIDRDFLEGRVSVGIGFGGRVVHDGWSRYRGRHDGCCATVPGRWELREERHFLPGCERKLWIEPEVVVWYDECGRRQERVLRPGHWKVVHEPGRWELRQVKVWVPPSAHCSRIVKRG